MATKPHISTNNLTAPLPSSLVQPTPANRLYVFAKTCTNDHGTFHKGDKARGAFAPELVEAYLAAGILVPAPEVPAQEEGARG